MYKLHVLADNVFQHFVIFVFLVLGALYIVVGVTAGLIFLFLLVVIIIMCAVCVCLYRPKGKVTCESIYSYSYVAALVS